MKFQGSKARIALSLLPIVLKGRKKKQYYVEPFAGGCNMIDKVTGLRVANDVNRNLMSCFRALRNGWVPPEEISRELYNECRVKHNTNTVKGPERRLIGYVGVCGSYGGRYYDGGYAGTIIDKGGKTRNFPKEAFANVMAQAEKLKGIRFTHGNYDKFRIPPKSIVYCDPPYEGTKAYAEAIKSGFSSPKFWEWCRALVAAGHTVYISEYTAPEDFTCVWEKKVSSSLRANSVISGAKSSVEKLFVLSSSI